MAKEKMIYSFNEPRDIPGFGVFEPGQEVPFNQVLFDTGLFEMAGKAKKGDEE